MKRLPILLIFLLLASYTNAQKNIYRQWNYDLTPFVGTWIAEKDDMQYEITLEKGNFNLDIGHLNYFFEDVYASKIRWFKNGRLLREVESTISTTILKGCVSDNDPHYLSMSYYDERKGFLGTARFLIDNADDPHEADWMFSPPEWNWDNKGGSDFPFLLRFKKEKQTSSTTSKKENFNLVGNSSYCKMIKSSSISRANAIAIIKENFNGDLFPELSEKRFSARIDILPDENGKIDSFHIDATIETTEHVKSDKIEISESDHPYIKELKRCINLVPDWDVNTLFGQIKWIYISETIWSKKGCKAKSNEWQYPDSVYYNDTLYTMKGFPLLYDTRIYARLRPYLNNRYNYKCERGFTANWELLDNRLYLKSIHLLNESQPFPLQQLFPDLKPSDRIEATWFSGKLKLTYGDRLDSFEKYYSIEIDCELDNGKLVRQESFHNYIKPRDDESYNKCIKRLQAMDWSQFRKLSGKMVYIYYSILPKTDGTVENMKVVMYAKGPRKGYRIPLPYISIENSNHLFIEICREELSKVRWEVVYERNEIKPITNWIYLQDMEGNILERD